jgi:hypothetical protein
MKYPYKNFYPESYTSFLEPGRSPDLRIDIDLPIHGVQDSGIEETPTVDLPIRIY